MAERPYHHGDLRRALVSAARQLLGVQGVDALSLRAVARRVGVSHGAPYRHFASKQELLTAVAAEGLADLRGRLAAARGGAEGTAGALLALAHVYVGFALERPAEFRLMFGSVKGPENGERHAAAEAALAEVSQVLADGRRRGELAPGDVRHMAIATWAQVHGLAQLLLDGQLGEEAVEVGVLALYGGLATGVTIR